MPKAPKQKQKLLYILQYLMEHTDENNYVTTAQIIDYLQANGINAERKSIYDDIETLCDFGVDIVKAQGRRGYQIASRDFELAELKLLVDLVQSSKFITTKKSRQLIKKLEKLTSKNEASQLHRQVVVAERNKTINESIYYNVDMIYRAMREDTQIHFQYFDWDLKKEMSLRKNGAYYVVSPWLLTWDDENYYLVAYDESVGLMKHYRVDKMLKISVSQMPRQGREKFEAMDVAAFSKKTFGMFAGEEKTVTLLCTPALTGVMVDRFGTGVAIRRVDDEHIRLRVDVAVSPQFFGWVAGLGSQVQIQSPESVAREYTAFLKDILRNYEDLSNG